MKHATEIDAVKNSVHAERNSFSSSKQASNAVTARLLRHSALFTGTISLGLSEYSTNSPVHISLREFCAATCIKSSGNSFAGSREHIDIYVFARRYAWLRLPQ